MTLRRGLEVAPGERLLVVEDVTTTGGSVREIIQSGTGASRAAIGVGALSTTAANYPWMCPFKR